MRIAQLVPARRIGDRTYAGGFHITVLAVALLAFAFSVSLSAQPITTLPGAGGFVSEFETARAVYSASARPYDCSAGGRLGKGRFHKEGLEDGVREALKILEECPPCRKFYREGDPVNLLDGLWRANKIIITDKVPWTWNPVGPPNKWLIGKLKPWKKGFVAIAMDLNAANLSGQYDKPCIYVNASSYLAVDVERQDVGSDGLTRTQARALVVLHELAHVVDVIPKDGRGKLSLWKSYQNTLCVRRNCIPCAGTTSACVHPPAPSTEQVRKSRRATSKNSPEQRKQ